ncbi:LuxR family transcriptional regulator [Geodermatophilus sabuli]|uniref:LuxR family transcriptional regulator n=1 Tax=Geodermatophilus sabuli TaxID=1564158 RepID=A0A7K3W4X8_9ACTN|nr:cupin domain-containing protein [Geodermatophilus sabuli]NEK59284.1 LuxR family transcriptional regulator [Geodermatophilus sabuli]
MTTDLDELATVLLDRAAGSPARRAAESLHPFGAGLRQTLLALLSGAELAEHEAPGAASLQVLRGRVRLIAGDDGVDLGPGQLAPIPPRRHGVRALEDAVVLLTVAVPEPVPVAD